MSIHDVSRTGMPVRFNMPFELGLACAIKLGQPAEYEVFVLDSKPYRIDRTLSDYKGRDPLIHGGTSDGMVACLLDTFDTNVTSSLQFRRAASILRKSSEVMKQQLGSTSLFRPSLFRLLVAAASEIARDRGFIDR